jgi:hypothetical protein
MAEQRVPAMAPQGGGEPPPQQTAQSREIKDEAADVGGPKTAQTEQKPAGEQQPQPQPMQAGAPTRAQSRGQGPTGLAQALAVVAVRRAIPELDEQKSLELLENVSKLFASLAPEEAEAVLTACRR